MIATLIGSTGLTGSFLVRQLLADAAITTVISVSRKSLSRDIYFSCLGTTIKTAGSKENFEKVDHAAIVAFASIAKAHDAKIIHARFRHGRERELDVLLQSDQGPD